MRKDASPVVHIAHPKPVPWNTIVDSVSEILDVPIVPYSQWFSKLEQAATAALESGLSATSPKYPAFHLLHFYRSQQSSDNQNMESDAITGANLDLAAAKSSSGIMADANLAQLNSSSVAQWLSYLKSSD